MMKTSTILISAEDTEGVYRSMQEVPEPLRKKLLRSTNSIHARTILIADRRGREEIARVLKKLPGAAQQRLSNALAPGKASALAALPKRGMAQAVGVLLAGAAAALGWWILSHAR